MDSLTKLNLDNYKPLRDVVFENLRSDILEGKLQHITIDKVMDAIGFPKNYKEIVRMDI